jgi:hypothetical protein
LKIADSRFGTVRRGPGAARAVIVLAAATLAAAGGCGVPASPPRKPNLYEVRGRVVDADTGQGVADARVRVRATIPAAVGDQILAAYAMTRSDGTYRAELAEGFDVVRLASEVHVVATKNGYIPGGADLPPPEKDRPYYEAPDVVMTRGHVPPAPPDLERLGIPMTQPVRPNPVPRRRR